MDRENDLTAFRDVFFQNTKDFLLSPGLRLGLVAVLSLSTAGNMFLLNRILEYGSAYSEVQTEVQRINETYFGPKEWGIAKCSVNGGVATDIRHNYLGYLSEAATCTGMSQAEFKVFLAGYPAP